MQSCAIPVNIFFVALKTTLPKFNVEPDNADAVQMNMSSKGGHSNSNFIGRVVETTLLHCGCQEKEQQQRRFATNEVLEGTKAARPQNEPLELGVGRSTYGWVT